MNLTRPLETFSVVAYKMSSEIFTTHLKFWRKMEKLILVFLCIIYVAVSQHPTRRPPQPVEPDCLKCLCQVDSGCTNSNCTEEPNRFGGGEACGWYKINKNYYRGCGNFGRQTKEPEIEAWTRCASEKDCAESCINLWITVGKQCDPSGADPGITICESHARKHFGGPGGCWKPQTDLYWQRVNDCLKANKRRN